LVALRCGCTAHLKATPLLKALYGFDPLSGGTYSWENFHQEVGQSAKL